MQKALYCGPDSSDRPEISSKELQILLDIGYVVVSVTSQHCAITGGSSYAYKSFGGFLIILEKTDLETIL